MSDERVLTKEIAEQFLADEYSVDLSVFTAIEDEAAECLSTHNGRLYLDGLTTLSDAAAESLGQHRWELTLNGLVGLSDAAVKIITKHQNINICLSFLTELPDGVAENLSKNHGKLILNGLTTLPEDAAEKLSKHRGELFLNGLTALPDDVAALLSKHDGTLVLNGLTEITDAAAKSLSKCVGGLILNGLAELSEQAARALADTDTGWGRLSLSGLTVLRDTPGHLAIAEKLVQQSKDHGNVISLPNLTEIGEQAAKLFGKVKRGVELGLDTLDAALASALIKKRKSKYFVYQLTLNRIERLNVEAARQLAKNKAPLVLDGLDEIDAEVAEALSKHADYLLSLNGLIEPSDEVLAHLSTHAGPLHLDGIRSLSKKGASCLAKCPGVELSLNGLRDLPVDSASGLRKFKGKMGERDWEVGSTTLLLNGVAALSDDAAMELSRFKGALYLEGLTACNDEVGHVALAASLAGLEDKDGLIQKGHLNLNQLAEITPEFAAGISKHVGRFLELNGLVDLSPEAAGALGAFDSVTRKLELNGLSSLSNEAAEQLVANPKNSRVGIELHLNGLSELADDIAEILASGFTSDLYLDGLKTLSDETALSLAKFTGKDIHRRPGVLSLRGLTNLSNTAAESLIGLHYKGQLWIDLLNLPESAADIFRRPPPPEPEEDDDVTEESDAEQGVAECPECGKALRTSRAKQCFECGADWH